VIDDRPAKKSGMKDGDIVLKIKDIDITDIYKYMEALSVIEPGSTVQVVIERNNDEMLFDVTF
jgi:S1-C subfamily serine protease